MYVILWLRDCSCCHLSPSCRIAWAFQAVVGRSQLLWSLAIVISQLRGAPVKHGILSPSYMWGAAGTKTISCRALGFSCVYVAQPGPRAAVGVDSVLGCMWFPQLEALSAKEAPSCRSLLFVNAGGAHDWAPPRLAIRRSWFKCMIPLSHLMPCMWGMSGGAIVWIVN